MSAPRDFGAARRVFFCIGAQRSGTTWLHRTLGEHPEIHLSRIKEVHYWDTIFPPHLPFYSREAEARVRDLEGGSPPRRLARRLLPASRARLADARRYRRIFREPDPRGHRPYQHYLMAGAPDGAVVGDVSPGYAMMGPEAFAAMDAAAPDARFVFVMRDPVARLWSNVRHNRSRGFARDAAAADLDAAFLDRLERPDDGPFRRSDYRRTILALEDAVPAERIAYFFYETLFEPSQMARLSGVLGVAPIRADLGRRVNEGADRRAAPRPELVALARERLAAVYEFAASRFGPALPPAWAAP